MAAIKMEGCLAISSTPTDPSSSFQDAGTGIGAAERCTRNNLAQREPDIIQDHPSLRSLDLRCSWFDGVNSRN